VWRCKSGPAQKKVRSGDTIFQDDVATKLRRTASGRKGDHAKRQVFASIRELHLPAHSEQVENPVMTTGTER